METMLVLSKDAHLDTLAAIGILILAFSIRMWPALHERMQNRHG